MSLSSWCPENEKTIVNMLTHGGLDSWSLLQTTLSGTFRYICLNENDCFLTRTLLKFVTTTRVKIMKSQRWSRQWHGTEQATGHLLNRRCPRVIDSNLICWQKSHHNINTSIWFRFHFLTPVSHCCTSSLSQLPLPKKRAYNQIGNNYYTYEWHFRQFGLVAKHDNSKCRTFALMDTFPTKIHFHVFIGLTGLIKHFRTIFSYRVMESMAWHHKMNILHRRVK